jgi:archaellum biogenesis protein FlaJ (TadC family)
MLERLSAYWHSLSWTSVIVGSAVIVAGFVLSYVIVSIILIKMPENYFRSDYEHHFLSDRHPVLRTAALVLKNIAGVLVIITGIILSFPGVPGPGLLTIFIGIMLTDIPGKRTLEAKMIGRPAILSAVNKLRARYDKPELIVD